MCLGRILYHGNFVLLGEGEDGIHVCCLTVKVNGHDGLGFPEVLGEELFGAEGPVRAAGFLVEGTELTLEYLRAKAAANPGIEFLTLPRYDEVVLFD